VTSEKRGPQPVLFRVLVLLLITLAGWWVVSTDATTNTTTAETAKTTATGAVPPVSGRAATADGSTATARPSPTTRLGWSRAAVERRRRAWEKKREAIRSARAKRPSSGSPPQADRQETDPALYAQEIRDALREIQPLLKECYESALENDEQLEGKLVLSYVLGGDESVGGIVEESQIIAEKSGDDLAHNEALVQCVTETVYTIDIDPPPGGEMNVTYPLLFSMDPDEEHETTKTR